MSRKTETLSRKEFFRCCPEHLLDQLSAELAAWKDGDTCQLIDYTVDSLGNIDSESSPRPSVGEPEFQG